MPNNSKTTAKVQKGKKDKKEKQRFPSIQPELWFSGKKKFRPSRLSE
jgi:hypothetical protein